jgi:hypothetical protein
VFAIADQRKRELRIDFEPARWPLTGNGPYTRSDGPARRGRDGDEPGCG